MVFLILIFLQTKERICVYMFEFFFFWRGGGGGVHISAWRGRGCLPVAIEVIASIIEIQQKDPHFR